MGCFSSESENVLSRDATGEYARWEARACRCGPIAGFVDGVQD